MFRDTGLMRLCGMMLLGSGAVAPERTNGAVDRGIRIPAVAGNEDLGKVAVPHGHSGDRGAARRSPALPPAFVVHQEEGLVVLDRPAQHTAELIAPQLVLGLPGREEKAARIESIVPEKFESRAMPAVGAALDGHVGLRAGVHAVFGRINGALNLELLNGLDRWNEEHGGLEAIGSRHAVERDVLIGVALAVGRETDDLPGHRASADGRIAVDPHAPRAIDHARHERGRLREVAAVQRKLHNAFAVDHGAERGVFGLEQGQRRGDLDSLGLLAHLHLEIDARFLIQLERNVAAQLCLESSGRGADFVRPRIHQRKDVIPGLVGRSGADVARLHPFGCNRGIGQDRAARVGDEAENLRRGSLREDPEGGE